MRTIEKANEEIIKRIVDSQVYLKDVVQAKTVIPELNGQVIMHAGPPNNWENMPSTIRGSCIGVTLFEGWAKTEEEAVVLLSSGKVKFIPCHHVKAVGPMGGITSGSMPVYVVQNKTGGNYAYCNLNEGIGRVLAFGGYDDEVINRLHWMKDVLAPSLSEALHHSKEGINLNNIMAKAITMGDEFHQRNMASSTLFLKEITPYLLETDISREDLKKIIAFMSNAIQFFLTLAMATSKATMDYAREIEEGSIVTAMSRNGYEFGIRVSGLGDQWFTAPVNTPSGLLFGGYDEEDISPDMGDSAIIETYGLGAMAMATSPAVARFVGAGGLEEALSISNKMREICIGNNPNYSIPNWEFKGSCLGIDVRKVVETGIEPLINTGMAHRTGGVGQVGAGTVTAPMACFEEALVALAERYGVNE